MSTQVDCISAGNGICTGEAGYSLSEWCATPAEIAPLRDPSSIYEVPVHALRHRERALRDRISSTASDSPHNHELANKLKAELGRIREELDEREMTDEIQILMQAAPGYVVAAIRELPAVHIGKKQSGNHGSPVDIPARNEVECRKIPSPHPPLTSNALLRSTRARRAVFATTGTTSDGDERETEKSSDSAVADDQETEAAINQVQTQSTLTPGDFRAALREKFENDERILRQKQARLIHGTRRKIVRQKSSRAEHSTPERKAAGTDRARRTRQGCPESTRQHPSTAETEPLPQAKGNSDSSTGLEPTSNSIDRDADAREATVPKPASAGAQGQQESDAGKEGAAAPERMQTPGTSHRPSTSSDNRASRITATNVPSEPQCEDFVSVGPPYAQTPPVLLGDDIQADKRQNLQGAGTAEQSGNAHSEELPCHHAGPEGMQENLPASSEPAQRFSSFPLNESSTNEGDEVASCGDGSPSCQRGLGVASGENSVLPSDTATESGTHFPGQQINERLPTATSNGVNLSIAEEAAPRIAASASQGCEDLPVQMEDATDTTQVERTSSTHTNSVAVSQENAHGMDAQPEAALGNDCIARRSKYEERKCFDGRYTPVDENAPPSETLIHEFLQGGQYDALPGNVGKSNLEMRRIEGRATCSSHPSPEPLVHQRRWSDQFTDGGFTLAENIVRETDGTAHEHGAWESLTGQPKPRELPVRNENLTRLGVALSSTREPDFRRSRQSYSAMAFEHNESEDGDKDALFSTRGTRAPEGDGARAEEPVRKPPVPRFPRQQAKEPAPRPLSVTESTFKQLYKCVEDLFTANTRDDTRRDVLTEIRKTVEGLEQWCAGPDPRETGRKANHERQLGQRRPKQFTTCLTLSCADGSTRGAPRNDKQDIVVDSTEDQSTSLERQDWSTLARDSIVLDSSAAGHRRKSSEDPCPEMCGCGKHCVRETAHCTSGTSTSTDPDIELDVRMSTKRECSTSDARSTRHESNIDADSDAGDAAGPAPILFGEITSSSLCFKVAQAKPEVTEIVRTVANRLNTWNELPANESSYWNMLWTWGKPRVDFGALLVWQRVNHFPGAQNLSRKDLLKRNINRFKNMPGRVGKFFDILPETYSLPTEYVPFSHAFQAAEQDENWGPNLWILKPSGSSRGRGISVVGDLSQVCYSESTVIQRYISRPLLLDGYKFDLRLYVLVTSFDPLEAFLYRDGLVRMCSQKYTTAEASFGDRMVHLTNTSLQQKSSAWAHSSGENFKKSLEFIRERCNHLGINWQKMWGAIQNVILKSLYCVDGIIRNHPNCFELFGYDILIDENLRPWLIEVNSSPSLARDTSVDRHVKEGLVQDVLRLVDPPAFDRAALARLLRKYYDQRVKYRNSAMPPQSDDLARSICAILGGKVPRGYGIQPEDCGIFERIAPSTMYSRIQKVRKGQ